MRTYMDGRFEEQRSYTDHRFQQVDDRFQQVDDRFQQVDDRFQQVDDRFQQVEALMMNSRAASSWHDIVPIRVLNHPGQEPPNFPDKVVKFWRLQRPRNQPQLVNLLRFYGIRASDLTSPISDDEEEEESDSLSESQSTLEEAVEANPNFALARLAARLGLDYGSISHNMGLYEQIQQARSEQAAQPAKREQPREEDKRPAKKVATSPGSLPLRVTQIPLELLLQCPDEFQYKSPTPQSFVGWAPGPRTIPTVPDSPSESRASEQSSSKKKAPTPSEPSEPSGGSTIPFTHTPSVVKAARKMTSTHTSSKQSSQPNKPTTSSEQSSPPSETTTFKNLG